MEEGQNMPQKGMSGLVKVLIALVLIAAIAGLTYYGLNSGIIQWGDESEKLELEVEDIDLGPICGDGMLDEGEQCDDGNLENDDGCEIDCTVTLEAVAEVVIEDDEEPIEETDSSVVDEVIIEEDVEDALPE